MKLHYVLLQILFFLFCSALHAEKPRLRVAVVGGGMAGVAAAHYIQASDPGAQVSLFEKEARLGGNARTVLVHNRKGQPVAVDAGPQYFTEGPWDEYIRFLKAYNFYNTDEISEFKGSISIQSQGALRPRLITPLYGSFRGENLGKLLWFKKFFSMAYKVYREPGDAYAKNIGDWVHSLLLPPHFKEEVIIPFLAASLGTTTEDIRKTATEEIVKLFAFRRPSMRSTFKVLHRGMGSALEHAGAELQKKGVRICTSSPVQSVFRRDGNYILRYENGLGPQEEPFDFVVLAVHAYQAARILQTDTASAGLNTVLNGFEYFRARIVLHSDSSFVNTQHPAFLNVFTSADNRMQSNTMNLGMVDERYEGIYKSWLSEELCTQVKLRGCFLHETVFNHPLITPAFRENLERMEQLLETRKDLYIGGGWTQGLETQETALISGRKAMEKYIRFKAEES